MVASLALLAILSHRPNTGPRFSAVVEIYRNGVWELSFSHGRLRSTRRTHEEDGGLQTWNNGAFDIYTKDGEQVFWLDSHTPENVIHGRDYDVVGWMGKMPIVEKDDVTCIPCGKRLVPLTGVFKGAQQILDMSDGTDLVVRTSTEPPFSIVKRGVSTPFLAIGQDAADFLPWKGGLLAANGDFGEDRDPGWGDLWTIGPGGSPAWRIIHRRGVDWQFMGPAKSDGAWLTARGYDGRWRNLHDYSTLYKLSKEERLMNILTVRGDWTFYGLDRTGTWAIGTRWLGWHMGAYDLIAVNIKSHKRVEIAGAVGECHLIEPSS